MGNGVAEVWPPMISAKRPLLSCGGSRAGCQYVSCRAGDTPASTETRGNRQSKIYNRHFPTPT